MPRITKRFVEAAEIRDKDYIIYDSEIPGSGARVLPSGKRSYLVQYRVRRKLHGSQSSWVTSGGSRRRRGMSAPRCTAGVIGRKADSNAEFWANHAACSSGTLTGGVCNLVSNAAPGTNLRRLF